MGEVRFMISEAAKQVQVESHVLRYWEEELELKIGRTEMGHRYYTEDDIQLFRCIKKLKNEGMLLRDLKPLIPELRATRKILASAKLTAKPTGESTAKTTTEPDAKTVAELSAESTVEKTPQTPPGEGTDKQRGLAVTPAEVIPVTQLEQVRNLIGDVLTDVVTTNNAALEKNISKKVSADVIREMDFLFQAKERQDEEHYRKLDCLIRQQQTSRREASKMNPLSRLKKILT